MAQGATSGPWIFSQSRISRNDSMSKDLNEWLTVVELFFCNAGLPSEEGCYPVYRLFRHFELCGE